MHKEDLIHLRDTLLVNGKLEGKDKETAMELIKSELKDEIIRQLNIEGEVIAIFPYGSKVYGTASEDSDSDYIIVMKSAMLPNGAFRNNAISSIDWSVQGVVYSRGGFLDAINRYEIGALECLSLPDDKVIYKNWNFKIANWNTGEMIKAVIRKASDSRHYANMASKNGDKEHAIKSMFHALRILRFGLQLKEHQKIVDFGECNDLYEEFKNMNPDTFDTRNYFKKFDELAEKLKE